MSIGKRMLDDANEIVRLKDNNLILRKQLETTGMVIKKLLSNLPDSIHDDESWQWCWDELSGDAQDAVKEARDEALAEIAKIGGSNETKTD